MGESQGVVYIVGIGPGAQDHATPAALAAIADAKLVVGYTAYIRRVGHLVKGKDMIRTGMTEEIGRARAAVERARDGGRVALISRGAHRRPVPQHGVRELWSADRDFGRFPGLHVSNPLVTASVQ
jgi:siroheme synthase